MGFLPIENLTQALDAGVLETEKSQHEKVAGPDCIKILSLQFENSEHVRIFLNSSLILRVWPNSYRSSKKFILSTCKSLLRCKIILVGCNCELSVLPTYPCALVKIVQFF